MCYEVEWRVSFNHFDYISVIMSIWYEKSKTELKSCQDACEMVGQVPEKIKSEYSRLLNWNIFDYFYILSLLNSLCCSR